LHRRPDDDAILHGKVSTSAALAQQPEQFVVHADHITAARTSSWRIEPSSPPATWTVEEYTIGDLV
jgi:hypothetical protein